MKYIKKYQINESLSDDILIIMLILYISHNNLTLEKMINNIKLMIVDFCKFMSGYGYTIDSSMIGYRFQQLIDKAFQKIKNKK